MKRRIWIVVLVLCAAWAALYWHVTAQGRAQAARDAASVSAEQYPIHKVMPSGAVHLYQHHQGVYVYGGDLVVRGGEVLGKPQAALPASTKPQVRLGGRLIVYEGQLAYWQEAAEHILIMDATTGHLLASWSNVQDMGWDVTEIYVSWNCRILPGQLAISKAGETPLADDVARLAYTNTVRAFDFYAGLGQNSWDSFGRPAVSTVHSGVDVLFTCSHNNAAFVPYRLQVVYGDGDGETFGPFGNALDVVGHEWMHAIIYTTVTWPEGGWRGLDYRQESGALNESYADLFGHTIEGREDWRMGEDVFLEPGHAVRDMSDPPLYEQPDHYENYSTEGSNSWQVHYNSGIANKAAYLMAEGGEHYGITVRGMGLMPTVHVWLHALRNYLTPTSTFYDARVAMEWAALDLGYPVSTVSNAWYAVGVGPAGVPEPEPTPTPTPQVTPSPTPIDRYPPICFFPVIKVQRKR